MSGEGTRTTLLDVTDERFGAVGDGVLLNDLKVTAGSRSISSASAPFRTTELDRGKLVYWKGDGEGVGRGLIQSVESPTSATLVAEAASTSRADGGPNMNGGFGSDNTTALNAAFAAAQAAAAAVSEDRRLNVPRVQVHVPRGVFFTRALTVFTQSGVIVAGEGRYTSLIASGEEGPWFSLGAYDEHPPDAFRGAALDWTFQDLHFINPCGRSGSSEGGRHGRAVQDNGSGGTRVLSCGFTGLEYGFCGAYGSDFSQIRDSFFYQCDTGYYFGPGSQQIDIAKTDAAQCREGAVFEGAPDWHLGNGSSFEDPSLAAITLEARGSGTTRLGVPVDLAGASYSGKFLIDGATWFETNSGGNGRLCPRLVWMHGDGPFGSPAEGLVIRDAYLIAGGEQVADGTNCFVEYDSAKTSREPVLIEDLVVGGTFINAVFRMSGTATSSSPRIISIACDDSIQLVQGPSGGAKIMNRDGSVVWPVDITAPSSATPPLRVRQRDDGTAPLIATTRSSSADVISGIASRGAVLEAFVEAPHDVSSIIIDAAASNYCFLPSGAAIGSMRVINAPSTATQVLTIEVAAAGSARDVRWPTDFRFASATAPGPVRPRTSTAVTVRWHPPSRTWRETSRAVELPI